MSCGIVSSAGASDATPSGPSSLTASIANRPSSTHFAIRRTHRPPASVVPQPHHIASKRVPNTTHPKEKDPRTPRGLAQKRIRAHLRLMKVSRGIFSSAGTSDAAPSGPSLFPASIAARRSSTHLAIRRTHRARPQASYPNHTTSHPSAYPTPRTQRKKTPKRPEASPKSESAHL